LRDAIAEANGEVHLAFQPKLDLRTDEISGVECLVRWKHPQRGFVPPAEFLPIIENTELIAPLTWLVLDQALATCASWHRHGIETTMAVNISARTIGSPELYDRVAAALEQHGLPPAALELELTESALLGDHHLAAANVARLRELGVGIAIDDFGTGYASIGYLTTMPISAVKIDGSFVDRMFSDEASAAVVNFSLGLGKQLGLVVVAEGIEDESTLEELRRLGCDQGQGYFISRPLGSTEFLHWLLAWSTRHLTPRDVAPELADRFLASQPSYRGPDAHRHAHDADDADDAHDAESAAAAAAAPASAAPACARSSASARLSARRSPARWR
jgi:EAL domain-containing protein (putative c-di-GMP-specific phosphodiesterase class I)